MNPVELAISCVNNINGRIELGLPIKGSPLTLVTPKGWKRPAKFPRGELLQVKENGDRVWMFDAVRVLAWLSANNFVKIASKPQ